MGIFYCVLLFSVAKLVMFLTVLTEGLTYSLFLLFFSFLIKYINFKENKHFIFALLVSMCMATIRGSMIVEALCVIIVRVFLSLSKKHNIKSNIKIILKNFLLSIICVFIILLADRIYIYATNGVFHAHTGNNFTIMSNFMILSDKKDADLIKDKSAKQVFIDTYNYMDKKKWNFKYNKDLGITGRAKWITQNHDNIKFIAFRYNAMKKYFLQNKEVDEFKKI